MFPLICFLILMLVSNAESRLTPGVDIDTDADTGAAVIRCNVSFNNFIGIQIFHGSVKVDGEEHIVGSVGKSNDTREDASVSVKASSGSAIFTGGFGILEMDHKSVQLNLTPDSNKSVIAVTNNTEVQWQGRDQLLITPIHRENHWIAGHAEYEVSLRSVVGLKDKVIISLAANSQKVAIDVNYEPADTSNDFWLQIIRVCGFLFVFLAIVNAPYSKEIEQPRSRV